MLVCTNVLNPVCCLPRESSWIPPPTTTNFTIRNESPKRSQLSLSLPHLLRASGERPWLSYTEKGSQCGKCNALLMFRCLPQQCFQLAMIARNGTSIDRDSKVYLIVPDAEDIEWRQASTLMPCLLWFPGSIRLGHYVKWDACLGGPFGLIQKGSSSVLKKFMSKLQSLLTLAVG